RGEAREAGAAAQVGGEAVVERLVPGPALRGRQVVAGHVHERADQRAGDALLAHEGGVAVEVVQRRQQRAQRRGVAEREARGAVDLLDGDAEAGAVAARGGDGGGADVVRVD